jgi:hypothetical protein
MASTLIVEDGSGVINADSYVSSAACDAYHTAFGNAAWALANDTQKDQALRSATQYLDSRYRFAGVRKTYNQALMWPRSSVWVDGVYMLWPVNCVIQACCELALRALSGKLTNDSSDQKTTSEKVGEIEVHYAPSDNSGQIRYAVVDDLLRRVATAGGSVLRVERV